MGERIKELRKALGLTQKEFGERIGIKSNTVATYEIGRNNPIDAVISLICREFNVNETWLRTGEGEMFLQKTREEEIAALMHDLRGGPDFRRKFISALSRMTEDEWTILEKMVLELAREVQEDSAEKEARKEELEAEVDKEVERYRQQLLSEKGPDTPVSSVKESGAV